MPMTRNSEHPLLMSKMVLYIFNLALTNIIYVQAQDHLVPKVFWLGPY